MEDNDRVTALEVLDPGHERPGYWGRFRTRILENAAFELARRREVARVSVAAVLSGWSRSLIPVAAAAALIASIMIANEARQQAEPAPRLVLEDMLGGALGASSFQAALGVGVQPNTAAFMTFVEEDNR
ncbi:MAG: hypothetical protein F4087_04095 [Gemmatimonadetes bacterium]|nr:hypothetical protein [Gemmatimonadota bacterium]MYE70537.1 hypothetical protein [Gemmatimonadota bacterium]MYJ67681.1 hypothetical protein [Gemmatimonadota bacterium]